MKVLLVVPRSLSPKQTYREYPLGVGMVATALRQRGYEVAIYDQNVEGADDEVLFRHVRQFAPAVVGWSVITPTYPVARRQIARLRNEMPDVRLVAGGIHASLFPEDLLADGADVVVVGEGQRTMPALLDRIGEGRALRELPGLVFRDKRGELVHATGRSTPPPADDIEVIDREVYNLSLYDHHSMLASLGCPYRCTFCCNFAGTILQRGVTVRPFERVIDEMRHLAERYGAKRIFFADDVFFLTRANILAFCRRLAEEKLDVQWIAQMRVDTIDREVADWMEAAGCQRVCFGVEAGSDAILRRIGKGIDSRTIRRGIEAAKCAGLRVKTGWIFGLPGSRAEQYETIPLMREIRPHEISIHQLIPFPGTVYYERPAEHGLRIRDPKDFASFSYGGLGDNISFDYLSRGELVSLMENAAAALEADGYVSSDRATAADEHIYTTPLSSLSMSVFHCST